MSLDKALLLVLPIVLLMLSLNEAAPASTLTYRKLLGQENDGLRAVGDSTNCQRSFVHVTQLVNGETPGGTPVHLVHVYNQCPNCKVAQVHLSCASFSSDTPIPPDTFKVVGKNDCLVNNGLPINVGADVSFEYASSRYFPLLVSSFQCVESG